MARLRGTPPISISSAKSKKNPQKTSNSKVTSKNTQLSFLTGDEEIDGDDEATDDAVGMLSGQVNLGDGVYPWANIDELTQDGVSVENKKVGTIPGKNMVKLLKEENLKLVADNEELKATIKVRDSEINALKKRNASLLERNEKFYKLEKGLRDAMEDKVVVISQLQKEIDEVKMNCSITKNENKALRKRLNNQGSHVKGKTTFFAKEPKTRFKRRRKNYQIKYRDV